MPGSRGERFRAGDLAEGLGLEMLRPFAFIAPVPRPEDVGADAVATLFKRENEKLFAEESFLVQAKASSIRKVQYSGWELEWLRALKMPLFWLSVDLVNVKAELWSMNIATCHPNFQDRKSVTMHLDERPSDVRNDELSIWLKKPILSWTPADASCRAFQRNAYEVLKTWITFEVRCLAVRPLGMTFPFVRWETNCSLQPPGTYAIMHQPGQLRSILEDCYPRIQTLISLVAHENMAPTDMSDNLLIGLHLVSDYMRQHGIDPDPRNLLSAFASIRISQSISRQGAKSKLSDVVDESEFQK